MLFFNDIRKFGYLKVVSAEGYKIEVDNKLGPEPLDKKFDKDRFNDILHTSPNNTIKQLLLNQVKIAGIGNIYADEICFYAQAKPFRRVKSLSQKEISRLHKGIKEILKKAIKNRGTSFSDYVDGKGKPGKMFSLLKVHKQEGQRCKKCKKGIIKKIRVSQRGTYYCNICQI